MPWRAAILPAAHALGNFLMGQCSPVHGRAECLKSPGKGSSFGALLLCCRSPECNPDWQQEGHSQQLVAFHTGSKVIVGAMDAWLALLQI